MTDFAGRIIATRVELLPGEVKTYRLPSTMPGDLNIHATALPFAPSNTRPIVEPLASALSAVGAGEGLIKASGGGGLGNPGGGGDVNPGGGFGGTGNPGLGNPGVLLMDLLHGDQVVQQVAQFGQHLVPQDTPVPGDFTWRLRLHLAPDTPDVHNAYPFTIELGYTSVLPVLTRRIPLAAFQQGFDKNWNGQNYVFANIQNNHLLVSFDNALASYYHLKELVLDLPIPVVTLNNVRTGPIHFGTGSSDSPFTFVSGRLPYVQLDVPVTHAESGSIALDGPEGIGHIELADFTLTFKFYLTNLGEDLMFATRFESDLLPFLEAQMVEVPVLFNDLLQKLAGRPTVELTTGDVQEDLRAAIQWRFDHSAAAAAIARAVKPWLVGADFDLVSLVHEPATTSADPFGGYIVVRYVGQEDLSNSPVVTKSSVGAPPAQLTDPFLFPDPVYVPRGDGAAMWEPRVAPASAKLQKPEHSTTPGSLAAMDHIVVVMMENRSFDHMLGYLSLEGGRTDVDGLKRGSDGKLVQFNYFGGRYYYPQPITSTSAVSRSPEHGHLPTKSQMTDGMKHFVSNYARIVGDDPETLRLVMGYYGANQLPTYDLLAREFVVCDRWFCSHIGPTWPNRFVTLTGDLNRDTFGEPETDTPKYADLTPVETSTLFDHLTERGVSWHYFQSRFGTLRAYTRYTFDMTNVTEFDNVVNGFAAAVRNGLPSVTFIDPSFGDVPPGNDDAPPADLQDGQQFIASILHTLFSSGNPVWAKTLLIVCYDEHGGFYDHVDPPDSGIALLGQASGKLGPRVPAFVVSALTPGRTVLHSVYDHSSIAATILRRFCSPHPPHMSARVSAARDLREAVTLKLQRNLPFLFDVPTGNAGTLREQIGAPLTRTASPDDTHALMAAIGLMVG